MIKRIASLFLALTILCTLLPRVSLPAEAATITGQCGDHLTWTLDTGSLTMTIKGSGSMWTGAGPGLDFQQSEYFDKIKTLVISGAANIAPNFSYMGALETLKILDSATVIEQEAFTGCKRLKTVQLPNSLTTIEASAFESCAALTAITIPSGVRSVGKKAFYKCGSLKSATIAAKSIGASAFAYCGQLNQIILQSGVEQIGTMAFASCGHEVTALYPLTIPASVKSIGEDAFWDTSFSKVTIEEGVKAIGKRAFHASRFKELSIPTTVETIGEEAFYSNESLKKVVIPSGVRQIGTRAFGYYYLQDYEGWKVEGFTIHGEVNTAAQRYAKANGFKFVPYVCFCDVSADAYYANAVAWAVRKGITAGVDPLHFGPKKKCAREQVVTFLWAANGSPEPGVTNNPFKDVKKNSWFRKAVLWALERGVTGGVDDTHFGVGRNCDRAQVVTFLWAAAGRPEPRTTKNPFTDVKKKDYYYKAVLWAVEKGITGGTTPTTFSPKMVCDRAQVVTFLYAAYGK